MLPAKYKDIYTTHTVSSEVLKSWPKGLSGGYLSVRVNALECLNYRRTGGFCVFNHKHKSFGLGHNPMGQRDSRRTLSPARPTLNEWPAGEPYPNKAKSPKLNSLAIRTIWSWHHCRHDQMARPSRENGPG